MVVCRGGRGRCHRPSWGGVGARSVQEVPLVIYNYNLYSIVGAFFVGFKSLHVAANNTTIVHFYHGLTLPVGLPL